MTFLSDPALRRVRLLGDSRRTSSGDLLRSGTRINLVLSNMLLPKVDGWTLFLHVRKYHPKIPLAFVTAIDDSGVRDAAMREGAACWPLSGEG